MVLSPNVFVIMNTHFFHFYINQVLLPLKIESQNFTGKKAPVFLDNLEIFGENNFHFLLFFRQSFCGKKVILEKFTFFKFTFFSRFFWGQGKEVVVFVGFFSPFI